MKKKFFTFQLITQQTIIPTLWRVEEFDFYLTGYDGLDAKTLVVWLLLAPNVVRLDLAQLPNNDLIPFIEQLNDLYVMDERVRPIFGRLVHIYSFPIQFMISDATRQYLFDLLLKIFPKALSNTSIQRMNWTCVESNGQF